MYETQPTPMPAPKRKSRSGRFFVALAAVSGTFVMLVLCMGVLGACKTTGSPIRHAPSTPAAVSPSKGVALGQVAAKTAAAVAPKLSAKPAQVRFSDEDTPGRVGGDFPAGTYRVTASVAGMDCYWLKASNAEGSDIVDNGLPQGGRPQVTLKKGQWFTSERCGTWVLQK